MGVESPTTTGIVRSTLKGIQRTLVGTATAQKAPAVTCRYPRHGGSHARRAHRRARSCVDTARILAGAFHRSELVSLDIEDCAFGKDGLPRSI